MTLTTFEREIAELEARGRELGMTDGLRRLVKRKYGQLAWEAVSAFMNSAPSFSVTAEMFDWLLECSSADEFLAKLKAGNGIASS